MPGVVYKISGDNSQFQKDVNQSESIAAGGFQKITALGIAAWAAIGAAVIKVTASGVNFLKESVNVGMGFDKSMSQVAATMGTTVDQISELTNFAMEMGATTAFSAQQAADGLNILAQSGLTAAEQMQTLPEVLNLAASGGLDLATASKYVTGAVKGFGDSFANSAKYTDMIAVGAAQANTNVNQLGLALSDAAATSSSYGQTAEGTTLALLRLAEQNVTGAEAATALNRAMMDLYTPTDGAKKALDKLGVSAYDSTGKARPLNDVIDELNKSMDGLTDAEKNQYKNAIFSTFGLQAFNKMVVSSDTKVNKFKTALNGASGAAKEMANTQLDNLAGDITLAKSASEGLKIAISNSLTPAIRSFVQKGTTELGKLKTAFEMDGFSGLSAQFGKSLSNMVGEVAKYVPEAIKAGAEFGKALISGIADRFDASKIIRTAAQLISNLGDALMKNAPTIGEKVGKLIADTLSNLPSLLDAGAKFVTQLFVGMLQAVPELVKGVKDGIVGMFSEPVSVEAQAVYDNLADMKREFSDFMADIQDQSKLKDIDAEYTYAEKWLAVFDELSKKTALTKDEQIKLNEAVNILNGYLPDSTKLVQDESGAWSLTTQEIKKALEAKKLYAKADIYLEKSKQILREIVDQEELVTTETKAADDALQRAFDKRSEAYDLKLMLEQVSDGLYAWEHEGKILMAQDLPAPVRALAEEWGWTGPLTRDMVQMLTREIENNIRALEEDAKAAQQEGEAHKEAASEAEAAIKRLDAAYDVMTDKATTAMNAAAQAEAQGRMTGAGFAKGILSQVSAAEGAGYSLANAATRSMKNTLMIKSPSKVTKQLGEYLSEGFALGIEDPTSLYDVRRASEKVGEAGLYGLGVDSITDTPVVGTENTKIDTIVTLLTTYLPNMGGDIVLDTGELVGHTIGQTDRELGVLQMRRAKYE